MRRCRRLLFQQGSYGRMGERDGRDSLMARAPPDSAGGVPFIGNLYQGTMGSESMYRPETNKYQADGTKATQKIGGLITQHAVPVYDDPVLRAKINESPYFVLADMAAWGVMSPHYLDPGLVSDREHQLLLLYSRAYYEKWAQIHKRPSSQLTRTVVMRFKGEHKFYRRIADLLDIPEDVLRKSTDDPNLFDDSKLIGLSGDAWENANLDPKIRDDLTGMTLIDAGYTPEQLEELLELVEKMRTVRVVRKDLMVEEQMRTGEKINFAKATVDEANPSPGAIDMEDETRFTLKYEDAPTLYELYQGLGLEPYNGQIKLYNLFDERGARLTLTLRNEEDYFDFLIQNFYNANLHLHATRTMRNAFRGKDTPSTGRTVLTVEPLGVDDMREGRWF